MFIVFLFDVMNVRGTEVMIVAIFENDHYKSNKVD